MGPTLRRASAIPVAVASSTAIAMHATLASANDSPMKSCGSATMKLGMRPSNDLGGTNETELRIPVGRTTVSATWSRPPNARGGVLFAHGSGSSRFSPRNRFVAEILRAHGLGTLLLDLLTPDEEALDERSAHLRFDIEFLAGRLLVATEWLAGSNEGRELRLGYFGASTGAAAALVAAAERPQLVRAIVSRGGRPDLAGDRLRYVEAPTLLLVGGRDVRVIEMNRRALARLSCPKRMEIVPRATHLFEEPGTLDQVARLAAQWFERFLARGERARAAS